MCWIRPSEGLVSLRIVVMLYSEFQSIISIYWLSINSAKPHAVNWVLCVLCVNLSGAYRVFILSQLLSIVDLTAWDIQFYMWYILYCVGAQACKVGAILYFRYIFYEGFQCLFSFICVHCRLHCELKEKYYQNSHSCWSDLMLIWFVQYTYMHRMLV